MRLGKLLGSTAAALAVLGMAAPASAQRYPGRHWGPPPPRHHHDDKVDGGDMLLGAALATGLIALFAGSKKPKPEPVEVADEMPPPPVMEASPPEAPAAIDYSAYDEESAADRCAAAVEEKGQAFARIARVSGVSDVRREGPSWLVAGKLEFADSYRDKQRATRGFHCTLSDGADPQVQIDAPAGT